MMKNSARLSVAAVAVALAGCVAPPDIPPTDAPDAKALWRQHKATMATLSEWRIKAKIAVKTGRKGGNATMLWAHQPARQEIELYGPFGSGRIRINARPGHAVLVDTKGRTSEGASAADALYQRLGWQVPFTQLRDWVRGIPGAGEDEGERATGLVVDGAGRLRRFQQGDWRVEYQNYATVGQWDLPQRLSITAVPGSMEIYDDDGAYIGDQLSVKVVLKRWQDIRFDD